MTNIIPDARLTSHHPAHRPRQSFKLEARDHFSHSRFQASCVSTSAERGEVEAGRAAPTVAGNTILHGEVECIQPSCAAASHKVNNYAQPKTENREKGFPSLELDVGRL